ncbi:hypothetical protein PtA15_7A324 [Puccinia triticina]|uniref:C2H2-type domain-containing protein n=1 Tax=Puccinia triticina TaxID=208348 RepID=A0ABY7CNW1_9BASI|nr:uncharacterized protein PtA15_7A324 [Puccinia triticina]WAQ86598.1 hypothetical protein PtA15_7A324 [Puccinia triticina]
MPPRPCSSLGFTSSPPASSVGINRSRPGANAAGSAGAASAADLYADLLPLDLLDDANLSIPPPPYELIDPIPAVTARLNINDHGAATIPDHGNEDSVNTNRAGVSAHSAPASAGNSSVSRQSAPASTSTTIAPVQTRERPSGIAVYPKPARPRGPRPLLTGRSHSELAPMSMAGCTVFGSQHPPDSARTPVTLPAPSGSHQSAKAPRKLAKYRPAPSNIVNRGQVNQVYQPATLYHPLSPSESAVSYSRPPLSNASRAHKIRAKRSGGQHRSSNIDSRSTDAAILNNLAKAEQTRNDHHQAAASDRSAGRAHTSILEHTPANCHAPSRTLGQPGRFVCPNCRASFYNHQLVTLHHRFIHNSHSSPSM